MRDGQERQLRIAGSIHDVNQVTPIFAGEVTGYITSDTLESLGWSRGFDELYFTVANNPHDRAHILTVAEEVKRKIEKSGREVYGEFVPTPGEHWAHENVESMLFLLGALGILALCMSAFLVINTMSALLTQHIPQIGIMKAIGARTGQLTGIYLGTVFAYSLLSLVVAVPLGAQALTNYIGSLLNFDIIAFEIAPNVLALEVAIGLGVPLLAALQPVFSGTRLTVREALNSYGLGKGLYGQNRFDRILNRIRRFPRPFLLSLRNTFRRKGRLILVVVTLTLASAIFVSVLSVQASLLLTLDDAMRYWNYDIRVNFGRSYRVEALVNEAQRVPGVDVVEAWAFEDVVRMRTETEQSDDILMIAPPAGTDFIDPIILEGRWLLPDDDYALVINTELLQEEPDLRVGDEMTLKIGSKKSKWRIVGLIKQPLSGPFVYVNDATFVRAVDDIRRVSSIRIKADEQALGSSDDLVQALKTQFEESGFQVGSTRTTAQQRTEDENAMNIIVSFLLIMAVLLAVVGGLGLMGTMSINVLERTREVGVMRAIGASNDSILRIVIVEGVLIGLLSWLIGAFVSLPLGKLLSDQVGTLFLGAPASYTFSSSGAFLWLGIMVFLSAFASFLPAWNAARLTVRETLAYQ
ncbi:ABC transporter permease [Chloroflexi bacterium TSY]|nr:ABC transporter permease [Chloroflexi bacterium TSY]